MSETPASIASALPGKRVDAQRAGITMTAFMKASDHSLTRRLTIAVIAIFVFVAAFDRLYLLYAHKFFDITVRAQWIWARHRISRNIPVAFFATHNFDLPPNRQFARIKVAVDPEYTLYFNGTQVGGRRMGETAALDVYDVSKLARDRGNRLVIAARSANGVGGVIASIDITDDYKNVEPTGSAWNIVRAWRDDLLLRDPPASSMTSPMLIGRPPIGRWNFLSSRVGEFSAPAVQIIAPKAAFRFKTAIPEVRDISGVPVVVPQPIAAIAYDFGGGVRGRVQFTTTYDNRVARAINVRFANDRSELIAVEGPVERFVFAPGEKTITDPEQRSFRYVMVYGGQATASVVQ